MRKLEDRHDYKSIREYIKHWVLIVSASALGEDKWLRNTERRMFIDCILLAHQGVSLSSKEAVVSLQESMCISKAYIYKLRGDLRKKGWLIQTSGGDVLPKEFAGGIPDELMFNIGLELKKEEDGIRG